MKLYPKAAAALTALAFAFAGTAQATQFLSSKAKLGLAQSARSSLVRPASTLIQPGSLANRTLGASVNQAIAPLMQASGGFESAFPYWLREQQRPQDRAYSQPTWQQRDNLNDAKRHAYGSETAATLQNEFDRKGGIIVVDTNWRANYESAPLAPLIRPRDFPPYENVARPVIGVTHHVVGHDEASQAPREFLQAVIARAQVFHTDWYKSIPPSAELVASAYMNMVKVFGDLTGSKSGDRQWAQDKDRRDLRTDEYIAWFWYEQLLKGARADKHLNDTQFFRFVRDFAAPAISNNPAMQYSLWEMHDRKHYRQGDPLDGTPIPNHIPSLTREQFDQISQQVYGTDGRGAAPKGQKMEDNVYGWMLKWLHGRGEI